MSSFKNAEEKAIDTILGPQLNRCRLSRFTRPTVGAGKPAYPTSQRDLKNLGSHFDLSDHTWEVPGTRGETGDTTTANVFTWQAAAQEESKPVKDWVKKNGSHSVIHTFEVPQDAAKEKFEMKPSSCPCHYPSWGPPGAATSVCLMTSL
jgi:hypothetical protein